jgi:GTP-binding protein HflX
VLAELGIDVEAEPERLLEVWNKADLLDAEARARLLNEAARDARHPCLVSAVTGEGLQALLGEIETELSHRRASAHVTLGPADGALANWLYENCEVLDRAEKGDGVVTLHIRVPPEKRDALTRLAGAARLRLAAE